MVRNTQPINAEGSEQRIRSADIEEPTLDSNRFVEIYDAEGSTSTAFGPGAGPKNRDLATGWADFDLASTPDGGTTINSPTGRFRWEIYSDDEKENLVATSATFTAADLRAAVSESRTDKRLMPAQQPLAGNDSHMVLAFKADAGFDGEAVTKSDSSEDLGVPYTQYK